MTYNNYSLSAPTTQCGGGADIAITLSRCVRKCGMCVGVYVSTIKRKPLIRMTCHLTQ